MAFVINESCVIIPTYNECNNIVRTVEEINANIKDIDIIIVDDNSPDGTGLIADGLSKEFNNLYIIHRSNKLGLSSVYKEGFRLALNRGYKYILQMDGDLSHHPRFISNMLERVKAGADMAIGSRYRNGLRVRGWSFVRLALSYLANCYARIMLGVKIYDLTSGFRCFNADSLRAIDLSGIHSEGFAFQIEMAYSCYNKGYSIEEIPIIFFGRQKDRSKLSSGMIVEAFFTVLKLRIHKHLNARETFLVKNDLRKEVSE